MYRFIIASLAFFWIGTSHAMIINDFTSQYSAGNWSITNDVGGITVDHSDPTTLKFLIRNSGLPQLEDTSTLSYQITPSVSGFLSFDWFISGIFFESTLGSASMFIPFQIVFSGDIDLLRDSSGHIDYYVTAGEIFEFRLLSFGLRESDILDVEITGFSAPVTEPGVIVLMGLGLIGLITTQRRKV